MLYSAALVVCAGKNEVAVESRAKAIGRDAAGTSYEAVFNRLVKEN